MRGHRGFVLRYISGMIQRARVMWKAIVAGTAALAIAGTSLVYAQQRGGRDGVMQGRQFTAEDLRAFSDARLAALKAGPTLNPDPDKHWPASEQGARRYA